MAGLQVFAWVFAYGNSVTGETSAANNSLALAPDGLIIDAEAAYETHSDANTRAQQYFGGIRAAYPNAFLAHAPFWKPSYHPGFPYITFGTNCQAVLPQAYAATGSTATDVEPWTPERMVQEMNSDWQAQQANWPPAAVKPIIPLMWAVGFNGTTGTAYTTGDQVSRFVTTLNMLSSPATADGYQGVCFYSCQHQTMDIWNAIGAATVAPAIVIKMISKPNGVAVPYCPVRIDGITAGSTDAVGRLVVPTIQCGSRFIEAVVGALHYAGFVNFQCGGSGNVSSSARPKTRTVVLTPSANTHLIEMDSSGSCANRSPLNNFAPGDVVEVFGTGNGLRARYPDPCGDSYIVMPDGSAGTIVAGGPQCCNGYFRWKIRYNSLPGIDLWSAEGELSTGQSFLRYRQSQCAYSLSSNFYTWSAAGGSDAFTITTSSSCAWTAAPDQNWITVSPSSGVGTRSINYNVASNNTSNSRSGIINVSGQIFTINQNGNTTSCTYSLNPRTFTFPAGGGSDAFNIICGSGCPWTAGTPNSWISVDGSTSGTGSHVINYSVDANASASPRHGTVNAGGQIFTVEQNANIAACSYSLVASGTTWQAPGGTGGIDLLCQQGCPWNASSPTSWITVNTPSGSGPSSANYTVGANTSPSSRTGTVTVAGLTYTVVQNGQPPGGPPADNVLGQVNFTSGNHPDTPNANSMYQPYDVAVDPTSGKIFVADTFNNRVLRFASAAAMTNGAAAEAVLGQPNFTTRAINTTASGMNGVNGLTVDSTGILWIGDYLNNRVLRFDGAASKGTGANADRVLGQPNFTTAAENTTQSGMYSPSRVFVDGNGALWVGDKTNHRILRFDSAASKANGANADGVLGQADFTKSVIRVVSQLMLQARFGWQIVATVASCDSTLLLKNRTERMRMACLGNRTSLLHPIKSQLKHVRRVQMVLSLAGMGQYGQ